MKAYEKIQIVDDLLEIMEFQFIRKFKIKNPNAKKKQIENAVREWYRNKENGPGVSVNFSHLQ